MVSAYAVRSLQAGVSEDQPIHDYVRESAAGGEEPFALCAGVGYLRSSQAGTIANSSLAGALPDSATAANVNPKTGEKVSVYAICTVPLTVLLGTDHDRARWFYVHMSTARGSMAATRRRARRP